MVETNKREEEHEEEDEDEYSNSQSCCPYRYLADVQVVVAQWRVCPHQSSFLPEAHGDAGGHCRHVHWHPQLLVECGRTYRHGTTDGGNIKKKGGERGSGREGVDNGVRRVRWKLERERGCEGIREGWQ